MKSAEIIVEADLAQLVDAAVEDDRVLGGGAGVAKAKAQVEAQGAPVGQKGRGAGPHPEAAILPHAPSPVQVAQAVLRGQTRAPVAALDPALGRQAVDLAVVVEAAAGDGDHDGHRFVLRAEVEAHVGRQALAVVEGRPVDLHPARCAFQPEGDAHLAVVEGAVALVAVARQVDAAAEGDEQRLFVQVAAGEIEGVDKDGAGVAQVGQGGGEEEVGCGDAVIVPAFQAKGLEWSGQPVEAGILQVAVEERLPGPADLDQVAVLSNSGDVAVSSRCIGFLPSFIFPGSWPGCSGTLPARRCRSSGRRSSGPESHLSWRSRSSAEVS